MNIAGLDVTIITGMSGAGRSAAADVLEDLGFFVIDNLPPALIANVAELAQRQGAARAVRARRRRALRRRSSTSSAPRSPSCAAEGANTRVLFLDAADDVLVRRYDEHPPQAPARGRRPRLRRHRRGAGGCSRSSRADADLVVDTSDLNVHELRDRLRGAVRRG